MVQTLNSFVLKSLHGHNVSAVSLSPHSIVKLNDHGLARMDYKIFEEYLDKHFDLINPSTNSPSNYELSKDLHKHFFMKTNKEYNYQQFCKYVVKMP